MSVTEPDSMATSVPVPIATPTSACARAGASLTPSPTIATGLPVACRRRIWACFSSGRTSDRTRSMPSWRAMARAVASLSPVSITTSRPRWRSSATAAAALGFSVSAMANTATGRPSMAANTGVLPSAAKPAAAVRSSAAASSPAPTKSARPTTTRRPLTTALTPWPATDFERRWLNHGQAQLVAHVADDGLGQRVLGALLGGGE